MWMLRFVELVASADPAVPVLSIPKGSDPWVRTDLCHSPRVSALRSRFLNRRSRSWAVRGASRQVTGVPAATRLPRGGRHRLHERGVAIDDPRPPEPAIDVGPTPPAELDPGALIRPDQVHHGLEVGEPSEGQPAPRP